MFDHELELRHARRPLDLTIGDHWSDSYVDVHASSSDLTEAWSELLSRFPNDVYAALKAAMAGVER